MKRTQPKYTFAFLVLALLPAGCQTSEIRIESSPSGGKVFIENRFVGETPYTIPASNEYFDGDSKVMQVTIDLPNYEKRSFFAQKSISQVYKLDLIPLSDEYFRQKIVPQFQTSVNEMTREILTIQGFIFSKKFLEAEKKIVEFQKSYPNIAASYFLQSVIEIERGSKEKAVLNLQRAQSLDPDDSAVSRALEKTKNEGAK